MVHWTATINGQYLWVEGKLTETQPSDFPARVRVYVKGIGTGIVKTFKPVEEARLTWESTHCPYCSVSMAEVAANANESAINHLTGKCIERRAQKGAAK